MTEQMIPVDGAELCVETFGRSGDPAVLLIHGACASMLWWEDDLCERIAAAGRYVVRYDNRDTGRSTFYPPGRPGYSMRDLAVDAVGILDALGIGRAHVVCRSMSGGIGLVLGVDHPARVASLTFVTTTTGDPDLPGPTADLAVPMPADLDDHGAVTDYIVAGARAYAGGSPHFPQAEVRVLAERDVARTRSLASALTNHYAMDFNGPEHGGFGDIVAPTLVVHGALDPVFPLAHGRALRDAVPGATLLVLADTGHEVPPAVWDEFVPALVAHTAGDR